MSKAIIEKTGKIAPALQKGEIAEGIIISIVDGVASDFMSPDQVISRMVKPADPFTQIEIGIPGRGTILKPMSIMDYTRIGKGIIPENSKMGKLMTICELKVDGKVPLIVKEVKKERNGITQSIVFWDVIS